VSVALDTADALTRIAASGPLKMFIDELAVVADESEPGDVCRWGLL
jgi:hypothetical protein